MNWCCMSKQIFPPFPNRWFQPLHIVILCISINEMVQPPTNTHPILVQYFQSIFISTEKNTYLHTVKYNTHIFTYIYIIYTYIIYNICIYLHLYTYVYVISKLDTNHHHSLPILYHRKSHGNPKYNRILKGGGDSPNGF